MVKFRFIPAEINNLSPGDSVLHTTSLFHLMQDGRVYNRFDLQEYGNIERPICIQGYRDQFAEMSNVWYAFKLGSHQPIQNHCILKGALLELSKRNQNDSIQTE